MASREHRRVSNQIEYNGDSVSQADRLFAVSIRRLLLRVIAMIEDRYGLRPANADREALTTD